MSDIIGDLYAKVGDPAYAFHSATSTWVRHAVNCIDPPAKEGEPRRLHLACRGHVSAKALRNWGFRKLIFGGKPPVKIVSECHTCLPHLAVKPRARRPGERSS